LKRSSPRIDERIWLSQKRRKHKVELIRLSLQFVEMAEIRASFFDFGSASEMINSAASAFEDHLKIRGGTQLPGRPKKIIMIRLDPNQINILGG
jgi:hypothetical protein